MVIRLDTARSEVCSKYSTDVSAGECAVADKTALACMKAAGFGAISADAHIAPAARVVLALVEKQPAASLIRTFANPGRVRGGKQLRCCFSDRPERAGRLI